VAVLDPCGILRGYIPSIDVNSSVDRDALLFTCYLKEIKMTKNPQTGVVTPATKGRMRVGSACFQQNECRHIIQCQSIYTQELLRDDGSCKEFHPKKIPEDY
jgi:hypothetical protein